MKSYAEWEYERDSLNLLKSENKDKDKTKGKTRRNWEISKKVFEW